MYGVRIERLVLFGKEAVGKPEIVSEGSQSWLDPAARQNRVLSGSAENQLLSQCRTGVRIRARCLKSDRGRATPIPDPLAAPEAIGGS